MPYACMPVLFEEIAVDLDLSLVQLGSVWGMVGLASATVVMIGGVLGDRFGIKPVLGLACILAGLAGASRGLAVDFFSISATVFAYGLVRGVLAPNIHKACGLWFEPRNLGTANGIVGLGMGIGLMTAPMISATVLSPWLDGWRNVMFFYAIAAVIIGLLWLLSGKMPAQVSKVTVKPVETVSLGRAIVRLLRIRKLWLVGLALMFRTACVVGVVGYLPLYLSGRGWDPAASGGALTALYGISTLLVVPMSLLSDRTSSRKSILMTALVISTITIGLIPFLDGVIIWGMVLLAGMLIDTYIILSFTMVQEIRDIEPKYYGAALGIVLTLAEIANFGSPILGNSLAAIDPGLPLLFWACLSLVAIVALLFTRESGRTLR
jgi:NNP family nitrate/nitrite transporter-like MFS transporter